MSVFGLGPAELIIILVIILVIFGPGKLPEISGAIGKSVRDFRKATTDVTKEFNESVDTVKKPIEEIRQIPKDIAAGASGGPAEEAPGTCSQCGKPNPPAYKFCGHCGAKLG